MKTSSKQQELSDSEARILLAMIDRRGRKLPPATKITTQAQAEANWIWDPKRGDVRPPEWPKNRRFQCTDENIEAQIALAQPGTLIHTAADTDCPRKAARTDEREEELTPKVKDRIVSQPRRSELSLSPGKIRHMAVAGFIENVNCLWCRRDYF